MHYMNTQIICCLFHTSLHTDITDTLAWFSDTHDWFSSGTLHLILLTFDSDNLRSHTQHFITRIKICITPHKASTKGNNGYRTALYRNQNTSPHKYVTFWITALELSALQGQRTVDFFIHFWKNVPYTLTKWTLCMKYKSNTLFAKNNSDDTNVHTARGSQYYLLFYKVHNNYNCTEIFTTFSLEKLLYNLFSQTKQHTFINNCLHISHSTKLDISIVLH